MTRPQPTSTDAPAIGEFIDVDVLRPVAGGTCLGRAADGRTVFVRAALPDESVQAQVTAHGKRGRFLFATTTAVNSASPHRVQPPCPVAGECGGCDWQHTDSENQRALKASVVIDALRRTGGLTQIAGVELEQAVSCEPVGEQFGWRTRMRYAIDDQGHAALRSAHSHDLVDARGCLIAAEPITAAINAGPAAPERAGTELVAAMGSDGQVRLDESETVTQIVRHRSWELSPSTFWQVHRQAPEVLVSTVEQLAEVAPGERVMDLYSGAGLFSAFLGEAVGITGHVDAVEADRVASAVAAEALADLTQVSHHTSDVRKWIHRATEADVIVLDPPRSGAGTQITQRVAALARRTIVYVACDPVALARDCATLGQHGWELSELRVLDLFPNTKHVECVAKFILR